ncbi:MAG: carboxylating nicotinate-nucleotide diphosphorylase [Pseudomonadota bacterium]|nr:carboxylating nicotinate-nucleotide diphosphorylase [Pseudomonadota bacterium]
MDIKELSKNDIISIASTALEEDFGNGDITSNATVPKETQVKLYMSPRQNIVLAGLPIAIEIFRRLSESIIFSVEAKDGSYLKSGDVIVRLEGPARAILSGERTALNIVQTLSGIATLTRTYVECIKNTNAVLLDTRKTIPGLRNASKYASRIGGATNHRMRLDDGVLIKDNHIIALGSVSNAIQLAKKADLKNIEVECDTMEQVKESLNSGADSLLLDNMSTDELVKVVEWVDKRIPLEASGGVNLSNIRAIAETGVDYISVGAITQSAPAVDIGLDFGS